MLHDVGGIVIRVSAKILVRFLKINVQIKFRILEIVSYNLKGNM